MTKPTIRELLDKEYKRDFRYVSPAFRELVERVEAVLRLHQRIPLLVHPRCSCGAAWPCSTIGALEGER